MVSEIKIKTMSKIGYVIVQLARDLITKSKGDRILTIGEIAEKYNTGRGTVQSALNSLEEDHAVKLVSRGHLGTFIADINYDLLWEISDIGMVMGLMPLPYSKKYEGLATGFNQVFRQANIPFSMAFMRGAPNRFRALKERNYDFAIASRLAAEKSINQGMELEILFDFGPGSYLSKHVLVFARDKYKKIEAGMTVGIDKNSIDHKILTELECSGLDVDFVELTYMQIMEFIRSNKVDAAIWNYDEIEDYESRINFVPLQNEEAIAMNKKISNCVLVVNKDDELIKTVLKRNIQPEYILKIQDRINNYEMIPEY